MSFCFCVSGLMVSKERQKSHKFLCLRVGKAMKKTFVSNASASMQQYAQRDRKHEYWFAVPQERWVRHVDSNFSPAQLVSIIDIKSASYCTLLWQNHPLRQEGAI